MGVLRCVSLENAPSVPSQGLFWASQCFGLTVGYTKHDRWLRMVPLLGWFDIAWCTIYNLHRATGNSLLPGTGEHSQERHTSSSFLACGARSPS